jgi:hypothetical protein
MEDEIFGPRLPILNYSELRKLLAKGQIAPQTSRRLRVQPKSGDDRSCLAVAFARRGRLDRTQW